MKCQFMSITVLDMGPGQWPDVDACGSPIYLATAK